jgi:PadR family transcriptional regulator, regulatory protein AphA
MSIARLTPTSYLILGLLAREGASTAYELERHVAATFGKVWSFARTLLYTEPARLARQGLIDETREPAGRHRRILTITDGGRAALQAWLDRPSSDPSELRDLGLLQMHFTDQTSPEARRRLAEQQLAAHTGRLSAYEDEAREERGVDATKRGFRTIEKWRRETLRMALLYEGAAVAFWTEAIANPSDTP